MRDFAGALEAGPSCPFSAPRRLNYRHPCRVRRRVPALAFMRGARSCSLVSAPEDGAKPRPLQTRERLPRSNLAVWGREFATCIADNAATIEFL